ncbi:hypothetical protein A8C56_07945 [Niabella ginsenosidivorans]|uniref:Glycosyl transferase family 1 n=1 Tax=Niabella ginsenosidivorans TaxID=1176587 RepID=A0A1A9I2K2_9BACT|nr:glycosyltransferase family 4 protein [Niabella ginsenosidivorans]ANH80921.1 hypothetical protein A8C56_07945 [Niabella ginsenosidivorans]
MQIIQIFSTSKFLRDFLEEQLLYFRKKNVYWTMACTQDERLLNDAAKSGYIPLPVDILRKITPLKDLAAIVRLIKAMRNKHFDIAIAHTPKGGMIGMIAARLAGVPKRVYYRHGLLFETAKGLKRKLLIAIEKLTAACATEVICISPSVLEQSIRYRLNRPGKNKLIGPRGSFNGINAIKFDRSKQIPEAVSALRERARIKDPEVIFGFAGRLVNDKGLNELAAAWQLFIKDGKKARLLVAGSYEQRDALPQATRRYLEKEPSVTLLGELEDMVSYYSLLDVFILPSHREGLPTVLLEAAAMELPVITTRATGCVDAILENKTGIFTTTAPEEIAAKMDFYYKNHHLRVQHGQEGRRFVQEYFHQEQIWKETLEQVLTI